jgi:hypothetical protein
MSDGKARILLWGIEGSGKSTSLAMIHSKLQADLRGEIRRTPTNIDPTVQYETLPIQLGKVRGIESRLEIVAPPGGADQEMTRKQLLDQVDGIILVIDASPDQIENNWQAISELRDSLADYGRSLDEIPIVVQFNKRDIADPFQIEDFHRRTGLTQAAVFETIATTGHGILATLTTISKRVVRARKSQTTRSGAAPVTTIDEASAAATDPNASSHEILEAAILAEAEGADGDAIAASVEFDFADAGTQPDWRVVTEDTTKPEAALGQALRIVSAGQVAIHADGGLEIPLVLGDENGQTRSVLLSLRLDSLSQASED